ncbi:hypothetical protein MGAST_06150 [Mycobacterium gastri 'Wayne']|nr:hypothetical protein MGAST_06150 [Mycobacterium gastri 'Wayne']
MECSGLLEFVARLDEQLLLEFATGELNTDRGSP